jgi:hypothetical protein
MADLIKPLASFAVAGTTTFNPGVCTNHISFDCEWNGPPCTPALDGPRMTDVSWDQSQGNADADRFLPAPDINPSHDFPLPVKHLLDSSFRRAR